jgi:hypothetical protein
MESEVSRLLERLRRVETLLYSEVRMNGDDMRNAAQVLTSVREGLAVYVEPAPLEPLPALTAERELEAVRSELDDLRAVVQKGLGILHGSKD